MGMFQVSITGLANLESLMQRLMNFSSRGLIRHLGDLARTEHQRRVLSEKTSPDGAPWAPLMQSTIDRKGSSEIMVASGRLADAFVNTTFGDIARIWNSAPYLVFHQGGTRKMVARPIMGLSDANIAEINLAANAFVHARLGL